MKAIVIEKPGGPEALLLKDQPELKPGKGEVRVRIRATAVNRADILQRLGKYPAPAGSPIDIPGLEYAGEIDALGTDVSDWAIGERVFGLAGGGTYAEQITVHSHMLARIPDRLSFEEAAAIPEAFITAYDALITQAKLQPGEAVLINGVTSGVGTAALQIAKTFGTTCIGTSRSNNKTERLKELGLQYPLVTEDGIFSSTVNNITNNMGVNVVLELVGGDYLQEDLKCIASQGRIILVGLLAGASTKLDLGRILAKRVTISGTTLRARPLEEKIAVTKIFSKSIVPFFAQGQWQPVIDKVFSLSQAAEAHAYMESNQSFGKVVLKVS